MNKLPNGIYRFEYNEKQRCFHCETDLDKDCSRTGWVVLKTMSSDECEEFTDFMDKKYIVGRKSGQFPELKVVKLELDLFFELKKSRRKLAGR